MGNHAIVIGIDDYPKLQDGLGGARHDARRFASWLERSHRGPQQPQIDLILSPDPGGRPIPPEHVVEQKFRDLWEEHGRRVADHGDGKLGERLVIFVAGHGISLPIGEGSTPVLLTADAAPDDPFHVSTKLYADLFREAGAFDEVLLFMDTCQVTVLNGRARPPSARRRLVPDAPQRYFYAFGAAPGKAAREFKINDVWEGRFTTSLLGALDRCQGPGEPTGGETAVPVRALIDDLHRQMGDEVRFDAPHTPTFVLAGVNAGNGGGDGSAPEPAASAPEPATGATRRAKEIDTPIGRWLDAAPTWLGSVPSDSEVTHVAIVPKGVGEVAWLKLSEVDSGAGDEIPAREVPLGADSRALAVGISGTALLRVSVGRSKNAVLALPACPGRRIEVSLESSGGGLALELASVRTVPAGEPSTLSEEDEVRERLLARLRSVNQIGESGAPSEATGAVEGLEGITDPVIFLLAWALDKRASHLDQVRAVAPDWVDPDIVAGVRSDRVPVLRAAFATIEQRSLDEMNSTVANTLLAQTTGDVWATWMLDAKRSVVKEWGRRARPLPGEDPVLPRETGFDAAARELGLAADVLKDFTYKSPPVEALVEHERIRFIGASNDQLPDSLAVAFDLRKQVRWSTLEIFFLAEPALRRMSSDARSPEELVTATHACQERLKAELPYYAEEWALLEYDDPYCFASLWDWDTGNAYAHLSFGLWNHNIRRTPSWNWSEKSGEPRPTWVDPLIFGTHALRKKARLLASSPTG